ncbi:MAG: carbohydrate-binding protein [Candidatus Binatia bacterium]|nr:carbohydrate-binding protein [Candidatus Binatia bacterium]
MTVDYVRVYEKKEIIPEPFTYVVLPDTQFMTMGHNQSQAEMFYRQTEWVVEKADELNIKFVSHLGDIVEFGGAREQWEVADQALSALDGKVPYGLTFGNHDADDQVWGRSDGLFNEYFPAWRYEGESWYGGGYPAGKNTNSYQLFRSGDAEYLVLHLQWDPPTDVRAWAGGILAAHPDRRAIVSTHEFPGNWVLWNEVLKHQANVFLIVSGHECARERLLTLENDFGGRVYSILTDYQCDNPAKAFLRYYEFCADGSVDAVTYSPWTDEYEIDDSSSFTFVPDHGTGIACENASQPWGGTAHPIPGRIEAEQYDEGCEGVAYHDLDGVNEGGAYRTDGVDLEPTNDGGVNLGWTRDGEWLNYNVEVAEEGRYDLRIRVASEGDGSVFRLDFDDAPLTGPIAVAPTGGWQIWTEGTVADLAMSAGTHVLTVHIEDGDFNLDWMEWTLASPAPTATPAPTASPGPTATPAPTATPLPTASPAPTGTPSPGPTPDPGSAEILYFQANRLHLIGQASTTTAGTLSRAPGTGGRFDRLPVGPTPLVYEITNLTVPYDPALQDTRLSLYLEGTSTAGVIAQARVRYDFEGDGTFDREETFTAGVAHATQGLHRYDSETFPLAASVGDYRDLDGGTVRLELWNPLVPVREGPDVRTGSAPAEHSPSHIVIPFAFPPTEIVAGETPRRRVDYPEGVLCPTDAPDPRCGPGFSDETALEEAALEQAITQGLAAFRFDGAHGSCAGCHVADAFDLAVIGYSDADIRRRALEHVSSEQAEQIVQLVHAQRQRHGLDRVLHPGHFRPLQPGFEPLPGDTVRERDFAFLQHLADEQNLILMNDVIDSREKALLAEQQLLALDVHSLRIGVRLDRWSEDSFHGPSHVGQAPYAEAQGQDGSVAEWLPNMATVPLANRAQEFYALFDAYAANPTDLAFWRFYDSIAEITESHEPLLNDDDSWAYEWMRTKYESIQVMGHMLRHQTLDFPDLAIDQPEPEGLDALAASILRNPLWRVGDMIRQRPLDCPTPELCTTFPPFVPNETDPAKLNVQSRVLQRAWFWAGWMVDRALLRSDESFATISGDYFYPLHHGFWNGHYAFITAKMSVEKANEASMSESWDNARAGHGKWASIRPFLVYKHSEFQRPLPGPTDPAYELNRRLMTNLARMWIYLVHADLERTGQAFDRAGTAKAVNFARLNWLDSVDPGGPREDIEARFTEIVDMLRTAEELRQPHHRFDLYEYLPVADVDVGPAP